MSTNPYEPPQCDLFPQKVDRASRTALCDLIRDTLHGRMLPSDWDDNDFGLTLNRSPDPTVRFVMNGGIWEFDDSEEFSKSTWDYRQRLLLLLESDRHVSVRTICHWSWFQVLGLGCALAVAAVGIRFWGSWELVAGLPFCIASAIGLYFRPPVPRQPFSPILEPFGTFAELSETYRATPSFRKERFRSKPVEESAPAPPRWHMGLPFLYLIVAVPLLALALLVLVATPVMLALPGFETRVSLRPRQVAEA